MGLQTLSGTLNVITSNGKNFADKLVQAAATPRKKTRTKKHKKERKKCRSSSSSSEDQGTEDRERRRSSRRDKNKHACCYDASTECTETSDNDYEMQIVEELHLARSNRQLHVKVEKSYGELTSMDVDPADESATIALRNVTTGSGVPDAAGSLGGSTGAGLVKKQKTVKGQLWSTSTPP
ncbi:protein FAM133A isoform X1 [Ictalurus punctatus]|uniref:Protein FAM133A isoform X1 n=1 Tax=Ictalurus punctatus TaxID=7998 RepID=A0A9F7TMM3_ICTPU|nr:protein FAM133A isoform X1 [Ictalurus punctatus]